MATDIQALNEEFINYLNYGGFPEAVMNPSVRVNPGRFLRQDIVDKVLLKDLPSLYGIGDTQELNRFFNVLAFNTGNELSLEALSKHSGISKVKLSDYLEYLEAAYLIRRVHRIDDNALRLQRARTFKVYLTNPSIRAALFGLVGAEDEALGNLAETAVWAQWLHHAEIIRWLHYARWKSGRQDLEVDIVSLNAGTQKPNFAVEIKWSDRPPTALNELRGLRELAARHALVRPALVTTRTFTGRVTLEDVTSSLYRSRCIATAWPAACYARTDRSGAMAKTPSHQLAYRAIRIEGGLIEAEELTRFALVSIARTQLGTGHRRAKLQGYPRRLPRLFCPTPQPTAPPP